MPAASPDKPSEARRDLAVSYILIAVGDDEDIKVKVDDKVLFAKYTGTEIKFDGIDYTLMDHSDILARVK